MLRAGAGSWSVAERSGIVVVVVVVRDDDRGKGSDWWSGRDGVRDWSGHGRRG